MKDIFSDKFIYHIYPLGLFNCAKKNDYCQPAGQGFRILSTDLDRIRGLGCNTLLLGPVFESSAHGYDTVDYYFVDRRLGNNQSFAEFCLLAKQKGFSILLDAVFNHTGREFFAFKDVIQNGYNSRYKDWFVNLNFNGRSCYGDSFDYEGWAGCKDLVKLNVDNPEVQEHLFGAIKFWVQEFGIDGLRLDAADVLSKNFLEKLSSFCRELNPNLWLMGEVVHGDYNEWAREGRIHSVTNYQIYKSLWSSVNSANFFELSYNLNREFNAQNGIYRYAPLYNFLDNHDVNRICSVLAEPQKYLYLVYGLMFAIPGIPSVYYGSELGIKGVRGRHDDFQLRPSLPPFDKVPDFALPDFDAGFLYGSIKKFWDVRNSSAALQKGDYREVLVRNRQFVFSRNFYDERVLVVCNSDVNSEKLNLAGCTERNEIYYDMMTGEEYNESQLSGFLIGAGDIRFLRRKH